MGSNGESRDFENPRSRVSGERSPQATAKRRNPPRRVGRKPKLTPEVHKAIVTSVSEGISYRTAANLAGISERTLTSWVKMGRDGDRRFLPFLLDIKKAGAEAVAQHVGVVLKAGEKSWQAAAWWLERMRPDLYGSDRREINSLRKQLQEITREIAKRNLASGQSSPAGDHRPVGHGLGDSF